MLAILKLAVLAEMAATRDSTEPERWDDVAIRNHLHNAGAKELLERVIELGRSYEQAVVKFSGRVRFSECVDGLVQHLREASKLQRKRQKGETDAEAKLRFVNWKLARAVEVSREYLSYQNDAYEIGMNPSQIEAYAQAAADMIAHGMISRSALLSVSIEPAVSMGSRRTLDAIKAAKKKTQDQGEIRSKEEWILAKDYPGVAGDDIVKYVLRAAYPRRLADVAYDAMSERLAKARSQFG